MTDDRLEHEIVHGKLLSEAGAGEIWNWESPAGRLRWQRRVIMLTSHLKPDMKVLELGCGKGEHSLGFAAVNPGKLYLGIDSKSHRICVGAEKAMAQGLENVMFLQVRIERIQDFFIA